MTRVPHEEPYAHHVARTTPVPEDLALLKDRVALLGTSTKISVLLVVSDADDIWIKASVAFVLGGVYPNVELCVLDNGSRRPHVRETLESLAASGERVKVARSPEPVSDAEARNRALKMATGEFVLFLDAGDLLFPGALAHLAEALQRTGADVAYADEDSIDISDRRSEPIFKPHYAPDLLLAAMYVGRPCAIRRSLLLDLGGLRSSFEDGGEHDLLLRVSERTDHIRHVPGVLYHRRRYEREVPKPSYAASERAVREALQRRGVEAEVGAGRAPGILRVVRPLPERPTVSAVTSFEGVAGLERGKGSPVREVIPTSGAFDACSANEAARAASGEYLLFLRGCREVGPGAVTELLREARQPEVGAVGGRVLTEEGWLRHAGGLIGLSGFTGSLTRVLPPEGNRIFLPAVDYPFNPYAVSAECLMVRRSVFEAAGGFDETHLPASYYDLDLTLRLREQGLLNVYVPGAGVVLGESDPALPGAGEIEHMWNRWWVELVSALHYEVSPLQVGEGVEASVAFSLPV